VYRHDRRLRNSRAAIVMGWPVKPPSFRDARRCLSAAAAGALIVATFQPLAAGGGAVEEPSVERSAAERAMAHGNLVGHGGPVKAVEVDAAHQRALTGSFDYAMMVWDLSSSKPRGLLRLDQHEGAVNAVAFVPQTHLGLAAGDDAKLTLWDIESGKLVHRFTGHTAKIVDIAVSDDGVWAATASWDRTARLWNIKTHAAGPVLDNHKGPVNAVAFSADARLVLTASYDGEIRMFETATGELVRPLYRHGWGINVMRLLPGGREVAFGALDGTAAIIAIDSGEKVADLGTSERPVLSLAVTPKPGLLAVGSGDGRVKVFRIGDFQLLEEYENPYGPVWGLAFAPGGAALYIAGLDDFVTRWNIVPRDPFEPIDSPFPRRFQVDEADSSDPIARGRAHFARKCSVCHTLDPDGKNRAGPTLNGLFGRHIASLPGYPYSDALKKLDMVWNEETVAKLFELGPENFTPGSKMPLQKMTDKAERDALIAYLKTTSAARTGNKAPAADAKKGGGR
jgi:cytochrome c